MPTSDAHPSRLLPRRPQMVSPTHSIPPATPRVSESHSVSSVPLKTMPSLKPSPPLSAELSEDMSHEHAIDFATHSWDLATGGLKTLTAKRELPTRFDRRLADASSTFEMTGQARSYTFVLIILVCVILMLVGGGVIVLVMMQP